MRPSFGNALLCRSGQLLILIGLLHIPLFMILGNSWEGPISWRKPILFGISTGMTLWSTGWIADHLKRTKLDEVCAAIVSVSLVIEVLLITLQQWRGRASHFNRSSYLDSQIDAAMLALITIAFAGLLYFTVRCFGRPRLSRDYQFAAQSGMLFLIVSCVIGFVISAYGYWRVDHGLEPETVGSNGVAKFPHGLAIHALQLFPAVAFVLRKIGIRQSQRLLMLWSWAVSTTFFLGFAIVQTTLGYGRFELQSPVSISLLSLGFVALIAAAFFVLKKR